MAEGQSKEPIPNNDESKQTELSEITQMTQGENHILLLNTKGEVFAFGDNSHGQLGIDTQRKSVDFHSMGQSVIFF
jgi:alpha-tubulin suppressor-like RCC1 family protein